MDPAHTQLLEAHQAYLSAHDALKARALRIAHRLVRFPAGYVPPCRHNGVPIYCAIEGRVTVARKRKYEQVHRLLVARPEFQAAEAHYYAVVRGELAA